MQEKHLTTKSPFHDKKKKNRQNKNRRELPQSNTGHLQKLTANTMLSGERLNASPLRSGTRQSYPPLPEKFSIVLEIITMTTTQELEITGIHIRKK